MPFVDLRAAEGVDLELLARLSGLRTLVIDARHTGEDLLDLLGQLPDLESISISGPAADWHAWGRQAQKIFPDCRIDNAETVHLNRD